jgi:hypothetical protein
MTDYKELGLFQRFDYERKDGKPLDPDEQLFSLRYDKDDVWGAICRRVLLIFADEIDQAGYKPLAADLRRKISEVQRRIEDERRAKHVQTVPQL